MKRITFVLGDLPNGKSQYFPIFASHTNLFGINQSIVPYLNDARRMVRTIEIEQAHDLGHIGRAESMCLDYSSGSEILAFNQCLRWELLSYVLSELRDINNKFGDGLIDRLE